MLQEVSHIGFLLPVSHVCLQIAFSVSHIGFTISPNFDNLTVKWNWRLICGWITTTLCLVWANIPLFPIDFNGKLEIFLKHLKKKFFLCEHVCVIGLWLFFRIALPDTTSCQLCFFFLKKKNFFFLVYSNTNNFEIFSCQPCAICFSHVGFQNFFFVKPCVDIQL